MTNSAFSIFDSIKIPTLKLPQIPTLNRLYSKFPYLESIAKSSLFFAAGTISHCFQSQLSYPFFSIASSMVVTHLAVKLYSRYNPGSVRRLEIYTFEFQKKYPYIQLISFIFIVLVGLISPVVSCCMAVVFGAFTGVILTASQYKRLQEIEKDKEKKPIPN